MLKLSLFLYPIIQNYNKLIGTFFSFKSEELQFFVIFKPGVYILARGPIFFPPPAFKVPIFFPKILGLHPPPLVSKKCPPPKIEFVHKLKRTIL